MVKKEKFKKFNIDDIKNIAIVTDGTRLQCVNKHFLSLFPNCNSLESFLNNYECLSKLFVEFEVGFNYITKTHYDEKTWVEYVNSSSSSHRIALLHNNKTYHYKLDITKDDTVSPVLYLVEFFDITEEMNLSKKLFQLNINLKTLVEEKTKALTNLNSDLINKVNQQVESNREKDRMLYHQAKMASMGEMLGNIAHQWRQPLSMISTAASGIKIQKENDILTDEFFYRSMDDIVSHSKHLSETIDDFRDFFKPNKQSKLFSIRTTFNRTLKLIDSKLKSRAVTVMDEIDNIEINGYESELIQVLMNLMTNACDAFDSHSDIQAYLFVKIESKEDNVVIQIKDNADGIDESIIDRIFEPYFSTKHQSQGTGIGLYMTEEIIMKHMQGKITVENLEYEYNNNMYKGALFTITLPKNIQ